ncbi:hypothetical protein A9200_06545 [Maribacter hydrothermalis]|uniref:Uncharacterized protein n=1 Tax=Maribacter hydrothermalis TaxID=1836467 RepID=A0A1B7Z3R5_9FLAO|nr:hypothetical protein BTR34_06785 [Maribacter hydrothermalis]OBR37306.1 hypothetical protein A9200_06545 [Maribacter hydrothermalis]
MLFFKFLYDSLNNCSTFAASQRGAEFHYWNKAEIIPKEPGRVMLPRDRALKKCPVDIFSEGPAGVMADFILEKERSCSKINFNLE